MTTEAKDCGVDRDYQGIPYSDAGFMSEEADRQMLPGNWLRAWMVSWEDFGGVSDLEPEERELKHYRFGFAETDTHYVVHYRPLLASEMGGNEATDTAWGSIGRETRYWIDKADFSVARRLFYK